MRRACARDVRSAWYALVRLKSVKLGPTTALSMGERAKLPDVWQIAPASASRGSLGCERVCYKSAGESVLGRVRVPRHCLVGVVKWCEEDRSHCTNEEGRPKCRMSISTCSRCERDAAAASRFAATTARPQCAHARGCWRERLAVRAADFGEPSPCCATNAAELVACDCGTLECVASTVV